MSIELPVVGFRKLSIADYPGVLSAALTVPGCNLRCPYCPHMDLVHRHLSMEKIPVVELLESLYPRVGFLDAVALTGGEPLLHRGLPDFLREVKRLGLDVKLDTNASKPRMLRRVMEKKLVDYISVHVVAPLSRYRDVSRSRVRVDAVREGIHMVRRGGVPHEFTITPVPGVMDTQDVLEVSRFLAGSRRLVIKRFNPDDCMESSLRDTKPYGDKELDALGYVAAPYFSEVEIEKP
jgi:pyruvate formate lyase activating enzyme